MTTDSANATPAAPARKPRRRVRLCVRLLLFVPLGLVLAVLLLARSPMVRNGIAEQLAEMTGAEVQIRKARIDVTGRLIARDVEFIAPGLDGPASKFVTVRKAEIDLDWSGVFSWSGFGSPRPVAVRLYNPVFRLSQSFDDGSVNLGALGRGGSGSGAAIGGAVGASGGPPTVDIFDGRLEFAEHSARLERFELLNTIHVAGSMVAERDGSYTIKMQEIGRTSVPGAVTAPLPRGMILAGSVHLPKAEASLRLLNLPLEAWPPEAVPTAFRDIWRRLGIQGRIRETVFAYDRASGVRLTMKPQDVAMDILIPAERGGDLPGDLSLSKVNGRIELSRQGLHADLEGVFEDQTFPARVVLHTEGTSFDCALTCDISAEGLNVARNPGFLPYVPRTAREYFEFFSGPTGEVDARVTIARGPPIGGEAAPVVVTDGRLTVRNGTAAFHKFPYPFHSMQGRATFDDKRINILDITGIGPTGARLRGSAQISPLTDDAQADVSITVTGVPVDEHLRRAMPGSRRRILEVLFNEPRHDALLAAGLVRPPAPPGEPAASDAESDDGPHEFRFGGVADIDIRVHRPLGRDVEWNTDVVVRFAEAGILPEPFPFPILARDVELRISDDAAALTRGTFAGLRGGRAELAANIVLRENGENVIRPSIRIDAAGVPVNNLLIHAVPEDADADRIQAVSAKSILRRLMIDGNVDCTAVIVDAGRGDESVDYDVSVRMESLEARPRRTTPDGESAEVRITGVSGAVRVRPTEVRVEHLTGTLVEHEASGAMAAACGAFTLDLSAQLIPPETEEGTTRSGAIVAEADVRGLSLGAPLSPLLAVFSSDASRAVGDVQARRSPEGRADVALRIDVAEGADSPRVRAAFANLRDVSFAALAGRVHLREPTGTATLGDEPAEGEADQRKSSRVAFDHFHAGIDYDNAPACSLALHGAFLFDAKAPEGTPLERLIADADMSIEMRDAAFESRFVEDLLAEGLEPATVDRLRALEASGRFDAHVDLRGEVPSASGLIGPRSLEFTRLGRRVRLPALHGHIAFQTTPDPNAVSGAPSRRIDGRVEAFGCAADGWGAEADGNWSYVPGRGLSADLSLAVQGQTLSDDLLGLLPADVADGAVAVSLRIDGGFSMPEARLVLALADDDPEGDRTTVAFDGTFRFAGGAADVGVGITNAEGEAIVAARVEPGRGPDVAAEVCLARFEVVDLTLTRGLVEIVSRPETDSEGRVRTGLEIVAATADCHEGRVWTTARIGPAPADGRGREFQADVLAAGVLFAPVLEELTRVPDADAASDGGPSRGRVAETGEAPRDRSGAVAMPGDRTRGMIDAWLAVAGRTGEIDSRTGRGAVRVANGDVIRLPVVLPLVQMSNLMLPSSDRFDYMQGEFHLRGRVAEFERVAVLSETVSLMGWGTVTLPEMSLDMRFNSRSNKRVPVLSDIFEALRDEIVTTRVQGTVAEPEVRSESLAMTRTVIGMLIDPAHARSGEIVRDRAARREQDRAGRAARPAAPMPPTAMPVGAPDPAGPDG
ncbi:MAG: hypothetical protein KF869_13730 [Phycisphaeraceae bacterium]|nr:hypothetical protein [Phycisphaeraceae bacterium]